MKTMMGDVWMSPSRKNGWEFCEDLYDEPHILIAGTTGAGKSTLLHSIIWSYINRRPTELTLALVDNKGGVELGRYKNLPHTEWFSTEIKDTLNLLQAINDLIDKRFKTIDVSGVEEAVYKGSTLLLVIDEMAALMQQAPKKVEELLSRIQRLGRAAKVHTIVCTQSPDRKNLPASLQQNATCSIGLRTRSAIESRQIIGIAGCEKLPMYGKGIMWSGRGIKEIQVPMTDKQDIKDRIDFWLEADRRNKANRERVRKEILKIELENRAKEKKKAFLWGR